MPKIKPTTVSVTADAVRRNIEARCIYFDCRTDEEIAEKLHIPKSTYADRRKNPRNWTLEQLIMVCLALNCTPQWLLTDHSGAIQEGGA